VDRITRKELKSDKFALEVQHGVEYVGEHRRLLIRYGGIAAIVIVAAVAFFFYNRHEQSVRAAKLAQAIQIEAANVGAAQNPYMLSFPTEAQKDQAATKAFTDIAVQYPGTEEGTVAEYFLGSMAADKSDIAQAEKRFKEAIDNGKGPYVSLAQLSLAHIYQSQGKLADAEKLLRSLIDKPTILVSKDEATIVLAQMLAPTQPDQARKLLDPLRGSPRTAVSRAAITVLGEMNNPK